MEHIGKIQAALAGKGLEALLLTDPISCRYATGFYFTDGAVAVTRDRAWLLTDSRYTEAAQGQVKTAEVVQFDVTRKLSDWVKEVLGAVPGPVGAEEDRLSHSGWTGWEETLGRSLTPGSGDSPYAPGGQGPGREGEPDPGTAHRRAGAGGRAWAGCARGSRSGRWPRN